MIKYVTTPVGITDYLRYLHKETARYQALIEIEKERKAKEIERYKALPRYKKVFAHNPEYFSSFDIGPEFSCIYRSEIYRMRKEITRTEYAASIHMDFVDITSNDDFWDYWRNNENLGS